MRSCSDIPRTVSYYTVWTLAFPEDKFGVSSFSVILSFLSSWHKSWQVPEFLVQFILFSVWLYTKTTVKYLSDLNTFDCETICYNRKGKVSHQQVWHWDIMSSPPVQPDCSPGVIARAHAHTLCWPLSRTDMYTTFELFVMKSTLHLGQFYRSFPTYLLINA